MDQQIEIESNRLKQTSSSFQVSSSKYISHSKSFIEQGMPLTSLQPNSSGSKLPGTTINPPHQHLSRRQQSPTETQEVLLLVYARNRDLQAIQQLFESEVNFDKEAKIEAGLSALAISMRHKDLYMADYLLNECGLTPESTNIVSLLLLECLNDDYN